MRRILLVELLGGFGDLLLALPAAHALARSHPDAELTVLTFAPGDRLLARDPLVGRVVATGDHSEGGPRRVVEAELRRGYDLVVTTTTYDGIGALCRGAAPAAVTDLWGGAPAGERVDRRFLRLLAAAGVVVPEHADTRLRVHLDEAEVPEPPPDAPVVLVPDAGMAVKRWPGWAGLVTALRGRDVPVLTTAPVDGSPLLPAGDLRALAGRLAAVGRAGGVVVGGDTGPVRLATAVGAPAVGLYGPTAATRYGLGPGSTDLQGLPGCPVRRPSSITEQECWWTGQCPLSAAGPACLADLGVEAVLAAVLERRRGGAAGCGVPAGRVGADEGTRG